MAMVMPAVIAGGFVRVSVMAIAVIKYERGAVGYSGSRAGRWPVPMRNNRTLRRPKPHGLP